MQEGMFDMRKIIGYRLEAIQPNGGFGTAAMLDCMVTGKNLSGSGGGSYAVSPEVFAVLKSDPEVQELIKRKVEALDAHPTA